MTGPIVQTVFYLVYGAFFVWLSGRMSASRDRSRVQQYTARLYLVVGFGCMLWSLYLVATVPAIEYRGREVTLLWLSGHLGMVLASSSALCAAIAAVLYPCSRLLADAHGLACSRREHVLGCLAIGGMLGIGSFCYGVTHFLYGYGPYHP